MSVWEGGGRVAAAGGGGGGERFMVVINNGDGNCAGRNAVNLFTRTNTPAPRHRGRRRGGEQGAEMCLLLRRKTFHL